MDEVFYDEELDRQYDCEFCRDTGKLDGSDYYDCAHCSVAQERVKLEERMENMKRSMPANDAMWSLVKSERKRVLAVQAAEMALLKSKLLQAERRAAQPVVLTDEQPDYELHCNGEFAAGASGKNAHLDILHYAAQYAQDGEIEIFKVTRAKIDPAILAAKEQANGI